jgi:NADPH:quinone reductase
MKPGQRVVVSAFGETPLEAIEQNLALVPMEAPLEGRGPREVVIAVKSAAVGWVDLLMTSGQYQHQVQPPYTPGIEQAGEVVWAGADVREVKVGDAVVVDPFLSGPRSLGDYQLWGGFASWAVAPAEAVRKLPAGMSFDEASNLLGNYETAWHCLVARGRLKAGETVLIHGASGATGMAAVEIARMLGARIIATGRSDAKLARVKAHGAHEVINVSAEGGGIRPFRDEVKKLTGGSGVDVVYDGVGGEISVESLRAVKFGARFLIVGWASTPFVARGKGQRGAPNANQLPTNLVLMKGLDVLGCPTAIATTMDPSIRAERLEQIWRWAEAGQLHPQISHVFPLGEWKAAMKAKWSGEVTGGCVLHP